MKLHKQNQQGRPLGSLLGLVSLILLSACASLHTPAKAILSSVEPLLTQTQDPLPTATILATLTPFRPIPSATSTPTSTPTFRPTPTSYPLRVFQTKLYDGIQPVNYFGDTCEYLRLRWDPDNASPGTVVVPFMYHGIRKPGGAVTDNITVTDKYFRDTMAHAKALGFETITIQQLENFLLRNAYIPPRSMLLIIDDRRLGTVTERMLPVLDEYNWTVTMAYITGVINEQEWQQVKNVLATGRVYIEAHGYLHNGQTYIYDNTPVDVIKSEIYSPIDAFVEHLGYRPTAFIWPGGDYNRIAVQIAHEAGYQVGFTANGRGPIMFNWVPLGEKERTTDYPLLVLPRYWSTAAYKNLDDAVAIGSGAAAFSESQRLEELTWYKTYCQGQPVIPVPITRETDEACGKCSK